MANECVLFNCVKSTDQQRSRFLATQLMIFFFFFESLDCDFTKSVYIYKLTGGKKKVKEKRKYKRIHAHIDIFIGKQK